MDPKNMDIGKYYLVQLFNIYNDKVSELYIPNIHKCFIDGCNIGSHKDYSIVKDFLGQKQAMYPVIGK